MPPPVRKLNLEDNSILQACGGVGAFRKSYRVEELKRDYHETLASLRQLGAAGAADLHEHGYMLIELPKWLGKLLGPFEVASYITEAGGPRSMATLNGKSLLARPEPRDNSYAFSEAAAGLAACARLVATALLGHRQGDILTPATTELLQPVASAYEHASAAHINLYEQHLHEQQQQQQQDSGDGRTSAYSPHVDGGLLTLVACPVRDGCLVVLRPGGGREHVPLEPGVAAVLPGLSLGQVGTRQRELCSMHYAHSCCVGWVLRQAWHTGRSFEVKLRGPCSAWITHGTGMPHQRNIKSICDGDTSHVSAKPVPAAL